MQTSVIPTAIAVIIATTVSNTSATATHAAPTPAAVAHDPDPRKNAGDTMQYIKSSLISSHLAGPHIRRIPEMIFLS